MDCTKKKLKNRIYLWRIKNLKKENDKIALDAHKNKFKWLDIKTEKPTNPYNKTILKQSEIKELKEMAYNIQKNNKLIILNVLFQ